MDDLDIALGIWAGLGENIPSPSSCSSPVLASMAQRAAAAEARFADAATAPPRDEQPSPASQPTAYAPRRRSRDHVVTQYQPDQFRWNTSPPRKSVTERYHRPKAPSGKYANAEESAAAGRAAARAVPNIEIKPTARQRLASMKAGPSIPREERKIGRMYSLTGQGEYAACKVGPGNLGPEHTSSFQLPRADRSSEMGTFGSAVARPRPPRDFNDTSLACRDPVSKRIERRLSSDRAAEWIAQRKAELEGTSREPRRRAKSHDVWSAASPGQPASFTRGRSRTPPRDEELAPLAEGADEMNYNAYGAGDAYAGASILGTHGQGGYVAQSGYDAYGGGGGGGHAYEDPAAYVTCCADPNFNVGYGYPQVATPASFGGGYYAYDGTSPAIGTGYSVPIGSFAGRQHAYEYYRGQEFSVYDSPQKAYVTGGEYKGELDAHDQQQEQPYTTPELQPYADAFFAAFARPSVEAYTNADGGTSSTPPGPHMNPTVFTDSPGRPSPGSLTAARRRSREYAAALLAAEPHGLQPSYLQRTQAAAAKTVAARQETATNDSNRTPPAVDVTRRWRDGLR